jgi:hypothetical protein
MVGLMPPEWDRMENYFMQTAVRLFSTTDECLSGCAIGAGMTSVGVQRSQSLFPIFVSGIPCCAAE